MGDTFVTIHTGNCQYGNDDHIQLLITKLDQVMASIQQLSEQVGELKTQVGDLQTAIDTEQQQVTDAINALNTTIAQLQIQITDGGTAEQRQAVLDQIIEVRNSLTSAKEDLASTIPDAPAPGPNI